MQQKILLYSHDSYGLGHLRRNLRLVSAASEAGWDGLVLTGSPVASKFSWPIRAKYVQLPGMLKTFDGSYQPLQHDHETNNVMHARTQLILSTAQKYLPDVFVVDKVPTGLLGEVLETLVWLKKNTKCRLVLGLRDILDDPSVMHEEWKTKVVHYAFAELYDEIWVYGCQNIYDVVEEYPQLQEVAHKVMFMGYWFDRPIKGIHALKCNYVLVTVGGGGDGAKLLNTFLDYWESMEKPALPAVMVAGPFFPEAMVGVMQYRCIQAGIRFHRFHQCMDELLDAAKVVVCMGGYNTVSETLGRNKPCVIVPRQQPRREQTLRAEVFERMGLATTLTLEHLTPMSLGAAIAKAQERSQSALSTEVSFEAHRMVPKRLAYFASHQS